MQLNEADEIFCTGNYVKIRAVNRYENKSLTPGPIYKLSKELYWEWMETS